jgi:hypothetical protein
MRKARKKVKNLRAGFRYHDLRHDFASLRYGQIVHPGWSADRSKGMKVDLDRCGRCTLLLQPRPSALLRTRHCNISFF